jgi:hypothetical protein
MHPADGAIPSKGHDRGGASVFGKSRRRSAVNMHRIDHANAQCGQSLTYDVLANATMR